MVNHPSTGNERLKIRQCEVALLIVADDFILTSEIEFADKGRGQGIQLIVGDEG
ncbi:MAG: hypothetical protein PHN79_08475 [Methanoregula sp.]|nr:hypothetical protein [Methanoregula sp.]